MYTHKPVVPRIVRLLTIFLIGSFVCSQAWATGARLKVTKKLACVPPNTDCSSVPASGYNKIKLGFKTDNQLPAFCYQISVSNLTTSTLVDMQVSDDHLDLHSCNFPTSLPPGGTATCYVIAEHDQDTTNTVTATARQDGSPLFGTSHDTAIALVKAAGISCTKLVTSADDLDNIANDSHVTLPADGASHAVSYSVIVTNPGAANLTGVTILDPLLKSRGCTLPKAFNLAAGKSTNFSLCTINVSCADLPLDNTIAVTAKVKPGGTSPMSCGTDLSGQAITVASQCSASVGCGGNPRVKILKEVACVLAGDVCGSFGSSATGAKSGSQEPAFCYRVTVTNTGGVVLNNITVVDDKLGDFSASFADTLAVGGSESHVFTFSHNQSVHDKVTVEADGASNTGHVTDFSEADANVVEASISCIICATSPDDQDGSDSNCRVNLLNSGGNHSVTYTINVIAGDVPLANVVVDDSQLPSECLPAPFSMLAHTTNTFQCQVVQNCDDISERGLTNTVNVSGNVDDSTGICAIQHNDEREGEPITVNNSCFTVVACQECPLSCLVNPATSEICEGSSQEFIANPSNGSGPFTFSWDSGETTSNITKNANGTFTCTVSDSTGCKTTCSATLTVNPNPSCSVSPENIGICAGGSQEFVCSASGGTPPYSFSWSSGETTSNITKSANGTYTCTVTDSKNCSTTCSGKLKVNPNPTCSVSPSQASICAGASQEFICNPSGGTAPYSFSWDTGETTSNIIKNAAGTFTCTVTDSKNCSTTCSATLSLKTVPVCSIDGPMPVCASTTNVYTSTATPGSTHSWACTGSGVIVGPATNSSVSIAATSVGSFTLTDTIALEGCTNNCPKTVEVQNCCDLRVTKSACIQSTPTPPSTNSCTGAAIAMRMEYTGNDINGPATVIIAGSSGATVTYNLPFLHDGDVLSMASENGFTIDATAHGKSNLGTTTKVTINGVYEVLHTSCSCKSTPDTNLKVCNPLCLDSSSPDNGTGSKGPGSPLWTLLAEKDPQLGVQTCDQGGTDTQPCTSSFSTPECVNVKYTIVVTNVGSIAVNNVNVTDDKLGMITNNLTVGPHQGLVLTRAAMICCTTTNTVTVTSDSCPPATAEAVVSKCNPVGACTPPYPFPSANPRTSIAFNESECLRGFLISVTNACMPRYIQVFYSDEHALTLGIRRVLVKTTSGTSTNDYPVSALPMNPGSVNNPQVGSTASSGDQAGTDLSDRPIYPVLYLTDITSDPSNLSGDWQYGGTPILPQAVFGTWKGAVRMVDKTHNPAVVTVTPDADPAGNGSNLGAGSDPLPSGITMDQYGAEVRWDVSQLGLVPGHVYRVYVMVHDGDQNKAGGDVGQACGTIGTASSVYCPCAPLGVCTPPYPYPSANPRTSIVFNESEVLRASVVDTEDGGCKAIQIRVYYNDEHALSLGVRRVIVKTSSATTTNNFTVSPLVTDPGSVTNPQVGTTNLVGDMAGTDLSSRPLYPALFITDITDNPNDLSGDWQFGGTAIPPHAVFGTWKGAVRMVDKTHNPAVVTVTPDVDPAKNGWNLAGGDPVPGGLKDDGYGAEVRWNVNQLGLTTGRKYRLYFMVHDGDQNKSGGDVGHACATLTFTP